MLARALTGLRASSLASQVTPRFGRVVHRGFNSQAAQSAGRASVVAHVLGPDRAPIDDQRVRRTAIASRVKKASRWRARSMTGIDLASRTQSPPRRHGPGSCLPSRRQSCRSRPIAVNKISASDRYLAATTDRHHHIVCCYNDRWIPTRFMTRKFAGCNRGHLPRRTLECHPAIELMLNTTKPQLVTRATGLEAFIMAAII